MPNKQKAKKNNLSKKHKLENFSILEYNKIMKNILKKIAIICVIAIMLIGSLSMLTACFSYTPWHGIPTGRYHPINADGEVMRNLDPIFSWNIRRNRATHLYIEYEIIKYNNNVYFIAESRRFVGIFNSETQILTVYMPADMPVPSPTSSEMKPFQFRAR